MPHVRNSRANVDAWPSPTQTVFGSELRVDRTGAGILATTRSRPSNMDEAYLQGEAEPQKAPAPPRRGVRRLEYTTLWPLQPLPIHREETRREIGILWRASRGRAGRASSIEVAPPGQLKPTWCHKGARYDKCSSHARRAVYLRSVCRHNCRRRHGYVEHEGLR